jgi:hypothetical protein
VDARRSKARGWAHKHVRLAQLLCFSSFLVANTLAAMIRAAKKAEPRIDTRRGQ